jgi:hypothetical protein
MAAATSGGSRIAGSGMGKVCEDLEAVPDDEVGVGVYIDGRMDGKYRWKNIVCKTPEQEFQSVICLTL